MDITETMQRTLQTSTPAPGTSSKRTVIWPYEFWCPVDATLHQGTPPPPKASTRAVPCVYSQIFFG